MRPHSPTDNPRKQSSAHRVYKASRGEGGSTGHNRAGKKPSQRFLEEDIVSKARKPNAPSPRMDTQSSTAVTFALLFLLCFQHSMAHPIDSLSPAKELASMEALLQRLEEKVSLMEDLQNSSPNLEDPESQREGLAEFLDDGNSQQVETPVDSAPFFSDRSALLKRMRGIQTAKSMRESGCFGRRLDRIGSVTGMGCRGTRRN